MYRFRVLNVFLFLTGIFFNYSCSTSDVLPSSSGKSGELIIVIDSLLWKSDAGEALYDSMTVEFPALPQYEPYYKVVNIVPQNFKSILQLHRNILIVETGPLNDGKKFALTMKKNVWSKPQLVMNLRVADISYLPEAVNTYSSTVRSKLGENELSQLVVEIKDRNVMQVTRDVKEKLNLHIPLTADYYIASSYSKYCWLRKETIHSSIGFQIYRFPYLDKYNFSAAFMMALRDSLSEKNVPGPSKGSYMITDTNFVARFNQTEIAGKFAAELRGLWRTHGDFMGGPFISYLINDEESGELIFIDGYVYAPKFNKKDYIKQIEATVHSIDFK